MSNADNPLRLNDSNDRGQESAPRHAGVGDNEIPFGAMNMNCHDYIPVNDLFTGQPALLCPVCGGPNVHPVGLECLSPGTAKGLVRIDADGVAIDPGRQAEGRGTKITLQFIGECGHGFDYVLHFHEGVTGVQRFARSMPGGPNRWPKTIWRD